MEIAERLLATFDAPVVLDDGRQTFVSASIGVALAGRGDGTADDVLGHADSARYQAKDGGRNRIEVFDTDMRANVSAPEQAPPSTGRSRTVSSGSTTSPRSG